MRVSAGFFRTLGVAPIRGRDFYEGEDEPGIAQTAIISYQTWHSRFGGRPDIVGRTVTLDGRPCTIVGVLPAAFHFAPRGSVEFWTPFHASGGCDAERGCHSLIGLARLKDGVTIETAQAEMEAIAARLERQYPVTSKGQGAVSRLRRDHRRRHPPDSPAAPGRRWTAARHRLHQCGEPAPGEIGRTEASSPYQHSRCLERASDPAVRHGGICAGVAAGAIGGLVAASTGISLLSSLLSVDMRGMMPFLDRVDMNWRVLSCAALIAVVALMLFSVAPAVRVRFQ